MKDVGVLLYATHLWPVQKTDGAGSMTGGFSKVGLVLTPLMAAGPGEVSLLEQVSITHTHTHTLPPPPGTWYEATARKMYFAAHLLVKPTRSSLFLAEKVRSHPRCRPSGTPPLLPSSSFSSQEICMSFAPPGITLLHDINGITLIALREQEQAMTPDS